MRDPIPIVIDRSEFDRALEYLREVEKKEGRESPAFSVPHQVLCKVVSKREYRLTQVTSPASGATELVLRLDLPPSFLKLVPAFSAGQVVGRVLSLIHI